MNYSKGRLRLRFGGLIYLFIYLFIYFLWGRGRGGGVLSVYYIQSKLR